MAELNCQFVRPDRLLYEGPVASLILVAHSGELGVWPGHAPEICSLGDGVVRLHLREEDGGGTKKGVIILADHARFADDIEPDVVRETRDTALDTLNGLDEADGRRAYWENKVKWCNLLLKEAAEQKQK